MRVCTKIVIVALAMLAAQPSWAASTAYIAEFNELGQAVSGVQTSIAKEPSLTESVVDFTSGVASSSPFGSRTKFIRLQCDARCAFKVLSACSGGSASASASKYIPADMVEYFGVNPGDCVSVIAKP